MRLDAQSMRKAARRAIGSNSSHAPGQADRPEGAPNRMWSLVRPPSWSFSRSNYWGSFVFNLGASILPPLYQLLSTVYLAQIDSNTIGTIATYTYLGVLGEIINEGLPRASYRVFGDRQKDHYTAMWTMLIFQMVLSFLLASSICAFAPFFTEHFAASDIQTTTVNYIRISSWSIFFVSIEYASGVGLRALDHPDIPLFTMFAKVSTNIVLDFLFLSSFRIVDVATPNTQASVRLFCDAIAAMAALLLYASRSGWRRPGFVWRHLRTLLTYGCWTFLESLVRNVIYLTCVKEMVQLGKDYGAAWSNFNTIRWGIIMCFNTAADGSGSTLLGHRWHRLLNMTSRENSSIEESLSKQPEDSAGECNGFGDSNHRNTDYIDRTVASPANNDSWIKKIGYLVAPAIWSALLVLVIEVLILVMFVLGLGKHYAFWISGGDSVITDLTVSMWNRIDWTYILWSVSMQLTAILTATDPKWTLLNSVCLNVLYIMPWAIYLSTEKLEPSTAWRMNAIVFGGVNVLNFVSVWLFLGLWLRTTKKKLLRVELNTAVDSDSAEAYSHLS